MVVHLLMIMFKSNNHTSEGWHAQDGKDKYYCIFCLFAFRVHDPDYEVKDNPTKMVDLYIM